jgi:hypothetical protein
MIFKSLRFTLNISDISMINQNTKIIRSNIRDSEVIETNCQDIHRTLNHSATIRLMTAIENINLETFFRTTRTIQTRLLQLFFFSFQVRKLRIRMILTELRNHFSIQINSQTSMNIHLDLIQSRILHSELIHIFLSRYVRIEFRNLHFHLDRMNSIEETTNTRARLIMRR